MLRVEMIYNPDLDGIDHINIYSKGKTELGRLLSNFAHTPFVCEDGRFESIEGYWYWLSCTDPKRDNLRRLYGFLAKKVGRELRGSDWSDDEDFKNNILAALQEKLDQNKKIQDLLKESSLPFTHYYFMYNRIYDMHEETQWIIDFWEKAREHEHSL